MPEIGAKRGDWFINDQSRRENIAGKNRSNITDSFNPAYIANPKGFSPAGTRQLFRLNDDGRVLVKSGRSNFAPFLTAQGHTIPAITFENTTEGELIDLPEFDMLTANRGRLIAKVKNKDQFFHLKLSELFWSKDGKAVPSNFIKIDPTFYSSANKPKVPSELYEDYSDHPASVRFGLFTMLLDYGYKSTDFAVVPMHPMTWYEIDARPPLSVLDFQDYLGIGTKHLQSVFKDDKNILRKIVRRPLNSFFLKTIIENLKPNILFDRDDAVRRIREALFSWIPDLGFLTDLVKNAFSGLIVILIDIIRMFVIAPLLTLLWPILVPILVELTVSNVQKPLMDEDEVEPLINAVIIFGGLELRKFLSLGKNNNQPKAFNLFEDSQNPDKSDEDSKNSDKSDIFFLPKAFFEKLHNKTADEENPDVDIFIDRLIRKVREDQGRTFPSDPPPDIPSRIAITYNENPNLPPSGLNGEHRVTHRRLIDYNEVLDIGIGFSHWFEHWTPKLGGEMHSLMATRPVFQQEKFNSIMYRFLNGPIKDGDGYNDGTTNFYKLVKLPVRDDSQLQKVAILWIDEQTYFSQRWRLVHPISDVKGDLFSQSKVLAENPHYFEFDIDHFYDPMKVGHANETSCMSVARQTILLTSAAKTGKITDAKIFSFNYNYGTSDYTWRWRSLPNVSVYHEELCEVNNVKYEKSQPLVWIDSLKLREDLTIVLKGLNNINKETIKGIWYQHVFPADTLPRPLRRHLNSNEQPTEGYSHPWHFMGEDCYKVAEKFPIFGAYEYDLVPRSQYYKVELIGSEQNQPKISDILDWLWIDGEEDENGNFKSSLYHNTTNLTWKLDEKNHIGNYGQISLKNLIKNRRNNQNLSMFEDQTVLKLLDRGPLGLIMVFADIRDDDLQVVSRLPLKASLTAPRKKDVLNPKAFNRLEKSENQLNTSQISNDKVDILLKAHHEFVMPPNVDLVRIKWGNDYSALDIEIYSPLQENILLENIWLLTIGYIEDGEAHILLRTQVAGIFQRKKMDHIGLRDDASLSERLTPDRAYCGKVQFMNSDVSEKAKAILNHEGRSMKGVSVWFENIVGQIALPNQLELP